MPNFYTNRCTRCFIGIDDDHDGNCGICAKWSDDNADKIRKQQLTNISNLQNEARTDAFDEIRRMLIREKVLEV
jgi:hypothetical protein